MNEKRKPFATITFSKPRVSLVTAGILMLFLAVAAVAYHIREIERLNARLQNVTGQLLDGTATLSDWADRSLTLEQQLEEAETKLREAQSFWQLREPAGFYIVPHDALSGRRTLRAIACLPIANGFEPYVFYVSSDREVIEDFVQREEYLLVGQAKTSADWEYSDEISEDFYTHTAAYDRFPYKWSTLRDWLSNEDSWYERLYVYCEESVERDDPAR